MELPLLKALRGMVREDGLSHDILDRTDSFVEVNFSQMYAYALFTGVADGWLSPEYLPLAEKMRAAANEKVDAYGFVRQVCGAPDFCRPGISPEGQAFYLLMENAAERFHRTAPRVLGSRIKSGIKCAAHGIHPRAAPRNRTGEGASPVRSLIFISVSRLVRLYPNVAINRSNAAWPSSVLLYTPASSRTSMNTWPISFWMISWMLSALTFS